MYYNVIDYMDSVYFGFLVIFLFFGCIFEGNLLRDLNMFNSCEVGFWGFIFCYLLYVFVIKVI